MANQSLGHIQFRERFSEREHFADGALSLAARKGIEIHTRSAFLQGLLLMQPEAAAAKVPQATAPLAAWRSFLVAAGVSPLAAALGFVFEQPEIARVVIGVHSAAHLAECLAAADSAYAMTDGKRFACDDINVTDPRRWSSRG